MPQCFSSLARAPCFMRSSNKVGQHRFEDNGCAKGPQRRLALRRDLSRCDLL